MAGPASYLNNSATVAWVLLFNKVLIFNIPFEANILLLNTKCMCMAMWPSMS